MSRESTPAERVLQARLAAHKKWAITDPVEGTKAARAAFNDRFANQADQDVKAAGQPPLSDAERSRRADHLRAAYFAGLALKSAQARRKKAAPPGAQPHRESSPEPRQRAEHIGRPCPNEAA